MPATESVEEFLRQTSGVPSEITDEIVDPEAIALAAGLPLSIDPMKPWLAINVHAYMPLAKFAVKQPFKFAAAKYDPLWALDDEELESIEPALEEALQRCLYDLNLSKVAGNPYVALAVALGSLSLGKYGAIQIIRLLESQKESEGRQQNGPRILPNKQESPSSQSPRNTAPQNPRNTRRGSSTTNGRMPESVDVSSAAGFRVPESPNSSLIEFDGEDE